MTTERGPPGRSQGQHVSISATTLTRRRSMIIEMQRQWLAAETMRTDPEDVCGVCGRAFEEPSVVAVARTDDRTDMGVACPECVEYLGRRNPEKFPTIEVYRALLAMY